MPEEVDDQSLVASISGGNEQALGTLYDRYASVMMAVGVRLLQDRAEVEDILHEVFLELWKKAHTFDRSRGTVRTWILLRMRSRTVDALRKKSRRSGHLSFDGINEENQDLEHQFTESNNPATQAQESQVRAMVMNLPTHHREVLLLSYFRGLTTSEIAELIEIPPGTVKSRLFAARKKLRTALSFDTEVHS